MMIIINNIIHHVFNPYAKGTNKMFIEKSYLYKYLNFLL